VPERHDGTVSNDVRRAALGSALFFLVAPVFFGVVLPWWLAGWRREPVPAPVTVLGAALTLAGGAVVLHAFYRFVREGIGTPAPVAPTQHLVVGGLYRYVRNPMYLAVLTMVVGQLLLIGRLDLLWYPVVVGAAFVIFVRVYEEPTLHRQFGTEYDEYRRSVRGWLPRLRPFRG
jgi:protein-S-isoprenylcysteine O-methyltransferase Ste14